MIDLRTHLFRAWFRLSRPMTLGVRAAVKNADGEVLLVRHTYVKGLYFPGGGVEHGETVMVSLGRELEEEAGVKLTGAPDWVGIFSNHRVMRNDHVCFYTIEASNWESTGINPVGREISEIVWCDPSQPPEDVTPGTRRRLREMTEGLAPDAYW